jgi:hypothetical protein
MTIHIDIQEALERGFDVQGLKTRACGLEQNGQMYRYSHSYNNLVGVEVLVLVAKLRPYFFNAGGAQPATGFHRRKT